MQIIGGALRVAGGRENKPRIVLKHRQPGCEVGGVVVAHLGGDAEVGRQERCTKFRDQFFLRIAFIAKTGAAEVTSQALFVFGPVTVMPISA